MQLKNVTSMDDYAPGSQAMALSYVDDSGLWNDSGFWDESGIWDESGDIFDVKGGCYIYEVEYEPLNPAFVVRFLIVWSYGNIILPPPIRARIALNDNSIDNPYNSGELIDPYTIYDYEHYKINDARAYDTQIENINREVHIKGRYTINYTKIAEYLDGNITRTLETLAGNIDYKIPESFIKQEETPE